MKRAFDIYMDRLSERISCEPSFNGGYLSVPASSEFWLSEAMSRYSPPLYFNGSYSMYDYYGLYYGGYHLW